MRFAACLALVALMATGSARADLVLTTEIKDVTVDPPKTETRVIYLAPDKLATGGRRGSNEFKTIYRGDKQTIWHLDLVAKSYLELDQASMQALGEQMAAAVQQMRDKLAQLPPEQRAAAEKMLQDSGGTSGSGLKIEVKPVGEKKTLEGKSCERWDVLVEGKRMSAIWVASWSAAQVQKEDFAALRDMASMFENVMRSNPIMTRMGGGLTRGMDHIDGFPVLVQRYDGDKIVEETTFKKAERKSIEGATFEIPPGYTRRELAEPKK
jgi:hypothetical protein